MRLTLDNVTVLLDRHPVLSEVDLDVPEGTLLGPVGPNGSGKSTLLRAVYRSLRPAAGAVRVGGDDVWALSAGGAARRTAAVLQDRDGGAAGLSVREVVALGRTPHRGVLGRPGPADVLVADQAIRRCGVRHLADRDANTLSGGERQRLLLARALAQEPRLLVLDEVTNHLDIRARFELLALVRSTGITTLAVLHDLDLAARFCDRLVVLDGCRVQAVGPVLDVLTPHTLSAVFGVHGWAEHHDDGVIRIAYAADPLAPRATPPHGGEADGEP